MRPFSHLGALLAGIGVLVLLATPSARAQIAVPGKGFILDTAGSVTSSPTIYVGDDVLHQ
jgi:hypothetical protein